MELILLDSNFENCSPPLSFSEAWYTRRYFGAGEFNCVMSASAFRFAKNAEYVYFPRRGRLGVLRDIPSNDTKKMTLAGESLEGILSDRVITAVENKSGDAETIIRGAVQKYAMTGGRAIAGLELGAPLGGLPSLDLQTTGGMVLSEWINSILTPLGLSYRIDYDRAAERMYFGIFRGLDRTSGQSANTWAIFSPSFENIAVVNYSKTTRGYSNFVYVTAEDDTYGRVVVECDFRPPGEKRREMSLASSTKSVDENGSQMTLAQFRSALQKEGEGAFASVSLRETMDITVNPDANIVYGVNYDLGDICEVSVPDLDAIWTMRLKEVDEVYRGGAEEIVPRFGDGVSYSPREIFELLKKERRR